MSKVVSRQEIISIINNLKRHDKTHTSEVTTSLDGKNFSVNTVSISRFEHLKEALTMIASCNSCVQEPNIINGIVVTPHKFNIQRIEIDNFIEKELKAKRDGVLIKWYSNDGVYSYDVLKDELIRKTNED